MEDNVVLDEERIKCTVSCASGVGSRTLSEYMLGTPSGTVNVGSQICTASVPPDFRQNTPLARPIPFPKHLDVRGSLRKSKRCIDKVA